MPKRTKRPTRSAAGSDADAKKQKPRVHVSSHKIMIPPNTEPESPILSAGPASQRAARRADENATSEVTYGEDDYDKFTGPFGAAVASACAKWHRPVTLNEVITKMTKTTGAPKFKSKKLKKEFAWRGFARNRWVISRYVYGSLTTSTARSLPVRRQGTRVYSTESPFLTTWPSRTSSRCMKMSVGPTSAVMKPYLFNSWPLASR